MWLDSPQGGGDGRAGIGQFEQFRARGGVLLSANKLCVCVCACVRACVRVCVWEGAISEYFRSELVDQSGVSRSDSASLHLSSKAEMFWQFAINTHVTIMNEKALMWHSWT